MRRWVLRLRTAYAHRIAITPPIGVRRQAGRTARSLLRQAIVAAGGAAGYDLVRRGFYSPLPNVAALPAEQKRSALAGVRFDLDSQLQYLRTLSPFLDKLDIPDRAQDGELHLRNGFYEAGDAEVLYAIVRSRRPKRVLELGSGFSTKIIARALSHAGGGEHRVYDPYALDAIDDIATLVRASAAELPAGEVACLGAGDILFVDTSHAVKMGGEVNHVVLDVLPRLAPGVAVHFHDIFMPWDYPQAFLTELRAYFTEQYLVQAFLAMNHEYEILLALNALGRLFPQEFAQLIPSVRAGAAPCGLWIERRS